MFSHLFLENERVHPILDLNDLKNRIKGNDKTCLLLHHRYDMSEKIYSYVFAAFCKNGIPNSIEPILYSSNNRNMYTNTKSAVLYKDIPTISCFDDLFYMNNNLENNKYNFELVDKIEEAKIAVFYTVNGTLPGLDKCGVGQLMIYKALEYLRETYPQVETYVTLSPIPSLIFFIENFSESLLNTYIIKSTYIAVDFDKVHSKFKNDRIKKINNC